MASRPWAQSRRDVCRWSIGAVLVFGIVVLVHYWKGSSNPFAAGTRASAEELLAQRFARGEIDEAGYRRRLTVLANRMRSPSRF
jgi:putative membrane protein